MARYNKQERFLKKVYQRGKTGSYRNEQEKKGNGVNMGVFLV
jgi:hypothetical protein